MKVLEHGPTRLVFEHASVGLGIISGVLVVAGVGAGGAAISMHEQLTWTDDFVRIGLALIVLLRPGLLLRHVVTAPGIIPQWVVSGNRGARESRRRSPS